MKIVLLLISLMVLSSGVFAQTKKEMTKEEKKAARQAKKQKKIDEGRFMMFPIAAPGYTPELGALVAAGGLMSFKTNRHDSLIQRSSMPFTVAYTTTGAIVAQAILTSFWFKDKLRINADLWVKDMPDNYWGVGYEKASEMHQSDTTTAYNRQWWWINPRFLFQVKKNFFVGLNMDYNYTKGTDAAPPVAADSIFRYYEDKPMNSGLGLILRYDSRDVPVDAWKGVLVDVRGTFYSTALGGDNDYQIWQIDYRQYATIGQEGQVLAWQIKTRIGVGDVPYGEMSQLGTPFDLRGYMWGRYRDNNMFFFLMEYRHAFIRDDGTRSPHGVVGWLGSGTVFNEDNFSGKTNNLSWLPNFGVGYRWEVQPRMTLRLDFGIGRESSGIYFNFNQAF
jgi:hypothetical protein